MIVQLGNKRMEAGGGVRLGGGGFSIVREYDPLRLLG